jgi:copper chaperone NosL
VHRRHFLSLAARAGAGVALVGGCAPAGPRAIAFGREQCATCRMTVDDPRYGAEVVTRTGRVHVFDSIECCAMFAAGADGADARGTWVSDVRAPGTLVDVHVARFWRGGASTPMGMGLVATAAAAAPVAGAEGPLRWDAVRALVAREGMSRGSGDHAP